MFKEKIGVVVNSVNKQWVETLSVKSEPVDIKSEQLDIVVIIYESQE